MIAIEICIWLPKWVFWICSWSHGIFASMIGDMWLFIISLFTICCFDVVPSCTSGRCWMGGCLRWADLTRPTHGNHLLVTIRVWEREVDLCSTSQPLPTAVYVHKKPLLEKITLIFHSFVKKSNVCVGERRRLK